MNADNGDFVLFMLPLIAIFILYLKYKISVSASNINENGDK